MMFLIFIGLIVLLVLALDSRKTIKYLRSRVDYLEYGLSELGNVINEDPEPIRRAEPVRKARAKRVQETPRRTEEVQEPANLDPELVEEPLENIHDGAEESPISAGKQFEDLIGGKLPIWIGGVALVFAGFFLVRFSIEAGLFGPAARCATAALFGLLLIGAAEFGHRIPRFGSIFKDDLRIGHSVAGAGIAVLYATLYMASELYGLFDLTSALIGVIAITILAFILSQKHGPPTAIMGLLGGFATPMISASTPNGFMSINGLGYTTTETYLYSASLLLLAIAWLARGIQTTNALLRIAGLLLLTLVTFKVFLLDAAQLEGVLRILSFLGLGFALIGIGWIYGKLMKRENIDSAGTSGG